MQEHCAEVRFQVRPWGYIFPALLPLALVVAFGVLSAFDPDTWWAWILLVINAALAAVRLLALSHAIRHGWQVVIDSDGVCWTDTGDRISWLHVSQIRVRVARGWRRMLPHLPDRIVLVSSAEAAFAARARSRPLGRPIFLAWLKARLEAIIDALRRFSDAPVVGRGGHQPAHHP